MKNWIPVILSVLLFSCSEEPEIRHKLEDAIEQEEVISPEENPNNQKISDFRSDLRKDKTNWNEEDTFIDTLELVEYNTDFDYTYAVFRNSEGLSVTINTNLEIDDYYQNRNFAVTWKVGKYYEAGEGEAIYFKEQLVAFEILQSSYSLEKMFVAFSKDYSNDTPTAIEQYINPDVALIATYNPGLYCVTGRSKELPRPPYLIQDFVISNKIPAGNFCDGYEGVKDGLYYEFIDETQLPTFDDMSGEGGKVSLYIEPEVVYLYFAKVTVITDGQFNRYLYFFNGNDKWYLWVEDFCDCSA